MKKKMQESVLKASMNERICIYQVLICERASFVMKISNYFELIMQIVVL